MTQVNMVTTYLNVSRVYYREIGIDKLIKTRPIKEYESHPSQDLMQIRMFSCDLFCVLHRLWSAYSGHNSSMPTDRISKTAILHAQQLQ